MNDNQILTSDQLHYIKASFAEYLAQKGINTRKPFLCPAHSDHKPSMSLFVSEKDGYQRAKCFACNVVLDTIDYIGYEYGLTSTADKFKKAKEIFFPDVSIPPVDQKANKRKTKPKQAIPDEMKPTGFGVRVEYKPVVNSYRDDFTSKYAEWHKNVELTDYFKSRGFSQDVIDRFELGYMPRGQFRNAEGKWCEVSWPAVVIPVSPESFVIRNVSVSTGDKQHKADRYRKTGPSGLFNTKAIETHPRDPIFIVESELDAISVEMLGYPSIGLGGVANVDKLVRFVEQKGNCFSFLIALDNDEVGQKAADTLMTRLQGNGNFVKIVNPYGTNKDANEALLDDPEDLRIALSELSNEADSFLDSYNNKYCAKTALDDFDAEIKNNTMPPVSTGFKALDYALEGGFYSGLHILGAVSSAGKTTMLTQFVDAIAGAGRDVLFFSLEMGRFELIAKAISRQTGLIQLRKGQYRLGKTVRDLMRADKYKTYSQWELDAISEAKESYKRISEHFYIVEGVGSVGITQIKERIQEHVFATGRTPIVVVDYLQILAPYDVRATDKQNTDRAVLELRQLARDYRTPVIAISAFNRDSYNKSASMSSAKESGAIEYGCDVMMALQFPSVRLSGYDEQAEKRKTPRDVELCVLKARSGPTGDVIGYQYYPQFNLFVENPDALELLQK